MANTSALPNGTVHAVDHATKAQGKDDVNISIETQDFSDGQDLSREPTHTSVDISPEQSLSNTATKEDEPVVKAQNRLNITETAIQRNQKRRSKGKPSTRVRFDSTTCHDNEHDHDDKYNDPSSPYYSHILMSVPIRIPTIEEENTPPPSPKPAPKFKSNPRAWMKRAWSKEPPVKPKGELHVVQMTRQEYLKYWQRDGRGRYCGSAPEGEGVKIWREKLGLDPHTSRRASEAPEPTSHSKQERPSMPQRSMSNPS